MKRIVVLLLIMLMLITMVACSNFEPSQPNTEVNTNPRFEYVCSEKAKDSGLLINYYRDMVTDVVYIRLDSNHGFSVMFNADGTPYLWSELAEELVG